MQELPRLTSVSRGERKKTRTATTRMGNRENLMRKSGLASAKYGLG
jgi:hypothetical protein